MANSETEPRDPTDHDDVNESKQNNIQTRGSIRFKEPHKLIATPSKIKKSSETDVGPRPKKQKTDNIKRPKVIEEIRPPKSLPIPKETYNHPHSTDDTQKSSDLISTMEPPLLGYPKDPPFGNVVRPATRHHLIDVHGLALFLRKTVRCFNCYCTNSLSMMGNTSRQEQPVVTRITLKCQNCSFSMYQDLLKPKTTDLPNSSAVTQPKVPIKTDEMDGSSSKENLNVITTPKDLQTKVTSTSQIKIDSLSDPFKIPLSQCRINLPSMMNSIPNFLLNPCFNHDTLLNSRIHDDHPDPETNEKVPLETNHNVNTKSDDAMSCDKPHDHNIQECGNQSKQDCSTTHRSRTLQRIPKQRLDLRDARIISQLLDLTETLRNELLERSTEISNGFLQEDSSEIPETMKHQNSTLPETSTCTDNLENKSLNQIKIEKEIPGIIAEDVEESSEKTASWRFHDLLAGDNDTSTTPVEEDK